MKLYQYAILWHPTKEQMKKDPELKSKVIVEVTTVLAKEDQHAGMMAAREIPEEYAGQLEQVEVAIRPF